MRRAGTVVRIAQGKAVIRCPDEQHPQIGDSVVDDELRHVGRVVDVIGPVRRPYAVLTAGEDIEVTQLLGRVLYLRNE